MTRVDFIHETAVRAAAAMSAIRGPIMIDAVGGPVEGVGLVLSPAEIATRARDVALALAEAFDADHPEDAGPFAEEWRQP